MPALWQSSQRPMYVRTIWVDGFRHVILTHDDPHYIKLCTKRSRPNSSASYAKTNRNIPSSLSHQEVLGECLRKFSFIRNDRHEENTRIPHIEKLNLSDVDDLNEDLIVKASPQPFCEIKNIQLNLEADNMRAVKSNRTSRTEVKENTDLSDRVLQWLDLAGKESLLTQENMERMAQQRHSWPEIQRRNIVKSKTATDLRTRETKPATDTKTCTIDRQEAYIPTSANTIENYARQSRNTKITRHDTKIKENKKVKDMRASVAETRQKMVLERSAVEKRYAEMVSKKLIPDTGKTKKQVHIFMPEALTNKGPNIASVPESLLSSKS
ncbi:hypothetical protein KGM_207697 [Danaus plexippus plexippus]|uniref:Uncharacterized protein n=1 Tax=Danaus plexippus plexippus TaxID=278856 RepID=A0A212ENL6_DANPL|nr:hypothetical protein KGM_207697 [Danaus plexippus plexippus]